MPSKKRYSLPVLEDMEEIEIVTRIGNMAVCYRLREKEARPSGVFVLNRQNKKKLK